MSLFDNLIKLTQAYDDDEDTFEGAVEEAVDQAPDDRPSAASAAFENAFSSRTAPSVSEPEIENEPEEEEPEAQSAVSVGSLFGSIGAKIKKPVSVPLRQKPAAVRTAQAVTAPTSSVAGTAVIYSFNDITRAGELAQIITSGQQVIMSIDGIDDALARRLLDVTIGICAAANATITKVSGRTYYVTPNA